MPSNMNRLDTVKRRMATELGDVVMSVETKNLFDYIRNACQRYYNACPIQKLYKLPVGFGTTILGVESATLQLFQTPETSAKVYFLGLIYSNYMLAGEEILSGVNPSPFNVFFQTNILGYGPMGMGSCSRGTQSLSPFLNDALARGLYATQKDQILGDETYEFDTLNNNIKITTPADGSVTVSMAFGYNGLNDSTTDTPLLGVPFNHLDLVAKLTAEEMANDIIMSRGIITMANTDFTINTDLVQKRLDELRTNNEKDLNGVTVPYILMA